MINTWNALFYTVIAIIPGFLIDTMIRLKLPVAGRSKVFATFRFIVLSALNYIFWIGLIPTLYNEPNKIQFWFLLVMILMVIVSPVAIGLIITFFAKIEWIKSVLKFIGFNIDSTSETAWDYKFYKLDEEGARYVVVTLKDDSQIYGKYGLTSLASNGYPNDDVYLQECYSCNNGVWKIKQNTDGVLICRDQIKTIEFYKTERESS